MALMSDLFHTGRNQRSEQQPSQTEMVGAYADRVRGDSVGVAREELRRVYMAYAVTQGQAPRQY